MPLSPPVFLLPHTNNFRARFTGKNSNKLEAPCFSVLCISFETGACISEAEQHLSPTGLMPGWQHYAVNSCWPMGSFCLVSCGLQWQWNVLFGEKTWLVIWGQVFLFSLDTVQCRAEGCSLLLPLSLAAKSCAGPCFTLEGRDRHTATRCSQLSGTPRCSCPPALGWHHQFACALCHVSPTWAGLVLCWWERRARKMPVFLWKGRLGCLSSWSATLKVAGEECTLFKDHSLGVFLWILWKAKARSTGLAGK